MIVPLPSLVRKFGRDPQLIELVENSGGQLKRIRRSRNWQIDASREQLLILVASLEAGLESSETQAFKWVAERSKTALGALSALEQSQLKQLRQFYQQMAAKQQQDNQLLKQELLQLKLAATLEAKPNLSASQLANLCNCSLAEARAAIDKSEGF